VRWGGWSHKEGKSENREEIGELEKKRVSIVWGGN